MISISNTDFATVLRLLGILADSRATTGREQEVKRRANLLLRKFRRKESNKRAQGERKETRR